MSTFFSWIRSHKRTLDLWSDLKPMAAVIPSLERCVKGRGHQGDLSEGHAKRTKTRQRFSTRARPSPLLFLFYFKFLHCFLHTAAVLDSRRTARISAGGIKDRNAAAFHQTYYRRRRRALLNISYRSDAAAGRRDRMQRGSAEQRQIMEHTIYFLFFQSFSVSQHMLIVLPRQQRDCKQPPSYTSRLLLLILFHFPTISFLRRAE